MADFFELMLRGGFGGASPLVGAAFVASLFWVAAARPERIRSPGQFRVGCMLFGLTFLVPSLVLLYVQLDSPAGGGVFGPGGGPGGKKADEWVVMLLQMLTPALLTASFLLCIDAVLPRRRVVVTSEH